MQELSSRRTAAHSSEAQARACTGSTASCSWGESWGGEREGEGGGEIQLGDRLLATISPARMWMMQL